MFTVLSGIAFVFGASRATVEFGYLGLIHFLELAAAPSVLAVALWVWLYPSRYTASGAWRTDAPLMFLPPRHVIVRAGWIVLVVTCVFVDLGALFGVAWLVRQ
jgi:hypothetical protein